MAITKHAVARDEEVADAVTICEPHQQVAQLAAIVDVLADGCVAVPARNMPQRPVQIPDNRFNACKLVCQQSHENLCQ